LPICAERSRRPKNRSDAVVDEKSAASTAVKAAVQSQRWIFLPRRQRGTDRQSETAATTVNICCSVAAFFERRTSLTDWRRRWRRRCFSLHRPDFDRPG
jgi:hypothetical protein